MDMDLCWAINLFSFSKNSCSTVSPIFRALVLGTSYCYASQKRLWSLHIQQTRGKPRTVTGVCLVALGRDTAPEGSHCRQNLQNTDVKVLNDVYLFASLTLAPLFSLSPICLCTKCYLLLPFSAYSVLTPVVSLLMLFLLCCSKRTQHCYLCSVKPFRRENLGTAS